MITLRTVLIDALWVLGLAGLLATFSYMSWVRTVQPQPWRRLYNLPRMLVPLCVSVELFCIGLALNGVLAYQPAPQWETIAWSLLALLFAAQTILYGWAGMRHGWDRPLAERDGDERAKRSR